MDIFEAIEERNLNELRQAIIRGASVNESLDQYGNSPLHYAVLLDFLPIVQELLNRGAQVNAQNSELNTPLNIAILAETDIVIVQELINRHPDLEARNEENQTPLHIAVGASDRLRSLEITQILLENGGNIDAVGGGFGFTPLQFAVTLRNPYINDINSEIVQALINGGADVFRLTNEGNTLLHLAVVNSAPNDILRMFLDGGVNVNAINRYQETPLHLAAKSRQENAQEAIRLLVSNNANMNALDNQNRTPLNLMALNPLESIVNYAEDMIAGQRLQAYTQSDENVTPIRNNALEMVLQEYYEIAHQNREQLAQDQNQQQLGAMIIPMNQDGVARNNSNQARRNARGQEQQNEQNARRVGPRS